MGQKSGITYTRLFSPAALAHQKVVRALPLLSRSSPEGQRAGGEKLPPTL